MSDDTTPTEVKIEEVGSDDEMPNLEPVSGEAGGTLLSPGA